MYLLYLNKIRDYIREKLLILSFYTFRDTTIINFWLHHWKWRKRRREERRKVRRERDEREFEKMGNARKGGRGGGEGEDLGEKERGKGVGEGRGGEGRRGGWRDGVERVEFFPPKYLNLEAKSVSVRNLRSIYIKKSLILLLKSKFHRSEYILLVKCVIFLIMLSPRLIFIHYW